MRNLKVCVAFFGACAGFSSFINAQMMPLTVYSDSTFNTGLGVNALRQVTDTGCGNKCAFYNTASGYDALGSDTTGSDNVASGVYALYYNTTGQANTASGMQALFQNTTGKFNTASGYDALASNKTGAQNTAAGVYALLFNTTGNNNTASGYDALLNNTSGSKNTASGYQSLYSNSTASLNSAYGFGALYASTTGQQNSALGVYALRSNTTGDYNTAAGVSALDGNTTGSSNIAVGYRAGFNLTTGSNNIDIGHQGADTDSGVIRIGSNLQSASYIAGIYNTSLSGKAVVVTSTGQLGVTSTSSERFKGAITPMGERTGKLDQLRPVTFNLRSDPHGERQYGLIAEEVAQVYPELVIRDEHGTIDGVRYDELAPMLLNEVQKQKTQLRQQALQLQDMQRLKKQVAELGELKMQYQSIQAAILKLQAANAILAMR